MIRRLLVAGALALVFVCAMSGLTARADDRYPGLVAAPGGVSASPGLVSAARRHMGATARRLGLPPRLWCADFANMVLRQQGHRGTGSRAARSFLAYGRPAPRDCIGCIAVLSRGKRGGHVGFVSGRDARGNPVIVSGNHNNRVAEAVYPAGRVIAYRMI